LPSSLSFFFNDTSPTQIYTLSLHDALPIFGNDKKMRDLLVRQGTHIQPKTVTEPSQRGEILKNLSLILMNKENYSEAEQYITKRSEEHTSELQSRENIVCRLLLEKKKNRNK